MAKKGDDQILKSRITKATDQDGVQGVEELQERMDADLERGFRGASPDPIPNRFYSQETDPTMSPGHQRIRHAELDPFKDSRDDLEASGGTVQTNVNKKNKAKDGE